MAKFLNIITLRSARKYAPPPPQIDYKESETNRTEPEIRPRSDDDTSLAPEYCDPADLVNFPQVSGTEWADVYSIPFDEKSPDYASAKTDTVYYSTAAGEYNFDSCADSDGLTADLHDCLDSRRGGADEPSPSSASNATYNSAFSREELAVSCASTRDCEDVGVTTGENCDPEVRCDFDDYDCPWDTGAVETEVYQLLKGARVKSDSEVRDECLATAVASAQEGSPKSKSIPGVQQCEHSCTGSEPGAVCPSLAVHSCSSPGRTSRTVLSRRHSEVDSLSFSNNAYGVPGTSDAEVVARIAARDTATRRPVAAPRDRFGRLQTPYSNVPLQPLVPPQAPPPTLPSSGAGPDLYDDPWDMSGLERTLVAAATQGVRGKAGESQIGSGQRFIATSSGGNAAGSAPVKECCGGAAAAAATSKLSGGVSLAASLNFSPSCKPLASLPLVLQYGRDTAAKRPGRGDVGPSAVPFVSGNQPTVSEKSKMAASTKPTSPLSKEGEKHNPVVASAATGHSYFAKELAQLLSQKQGSSGAEKGTPLTDRKIAAGASAAPLTTRPTAFGKGEMSAGTGIRQPDMQSPGQGDRCRSGDVSPSVMARTFNAAGGISPFDKVGILVMPDSERQLSERMDPTLPLEKQSWYHSVITRQRSENLLAEASQGSFLVRVSVTNTEDYTLSLRLLSGVIHIKIEVRADGCYVLGQFSEPFHSIPDMIEHYTRHRVNIRNAEHTTLTRPIARQ